MLLKCVTIILLASFCFLSASNAKEIAASAPIKLYLTISNEDQVFNDLSERRFQRMILREIIGLGKHEFQIFDRKDLAELAITGEVLRIYLRPASSPESMEIHLSLNSYLDGKKKTSRDHTIKVLKNQAFSSGISQIIHILK